MNDNTNIENKLKESEARFRSYFNMPFNGVAITSPEKSWIEVNDKICLMLGYTVKEILKMTWKEITHPEDIAASEIQFNRLLSGEIEQYNIDKRYIRKDKSIIWTNVSVGCVRKQNGEADYLITLIVDITDRKKIEHELKEKNTLLTIILENAPIGFAVNKIESGEIIFMSDKFQKIYNIENKGVHSIDTFFEKAYTNPIRREEMHKKIMDDINSKNPLNMKWENVVINTSTGDKFVTANNIPVYEQDLMISTVQDVTDQNMKDESLKEKMEELEKMNRLMVGRELKMSEIKEEDTLLKEKISKQGL